MLLKRIKFHNFRPFIGDQEVNLQPLPGKPDAGVTVIVGDNTFGKSTFVLSFIWCLYGVSKFSKPNDILNKKVEERLSFGETETAYVEIEFVEDDITYVMKRTQNFSKTVDGKLKAGNAIPQLFYIKDRKESKTLGKDEISVINNTIKNILPEKLSSFFFFEGEKNNELKKKELGDSVRTLLGLEAFNNMKTHLFGTNINTPSANSVMGYYLSKQNDESNAKAQEEYTKKINAEKELDAIKARIEEIKVQIEGYKEKIAVINETLRQAAPSKELQKRRDEIVKEKSAAEEQLALNSKRLLTCFSKQSLPLLMYPFLEKTKLRLQEMDVADKGIKGIEASAIKALLERGECLCGMDLKKGSPAYKNVEKYIDFIPPKSVGTIVSEMIENIEKTEYDAEQFVTQFEQNYKAIAECKVRINNLENEEKEKLAEISKIGNIDTSKAEANLYSYNKSIKDLEAELERKNTEKGHKESEIKSAEEKFNQFKSKSEKAQEYQLYYKYAEMLYDWVNRSYKEKEDGMRIRLTNYVTELFNNMYSGHRDITIDEKYNLKMTYRDGDVDDTGGLRVIQYFAYVAGLVKLAYEVMQEREKDDDGNVEALGEQYPLVLDAAFSHADEGHTVSIARELSNSVNQLILAVMRKDWNIAQRGLVGKVGRIYELKKIDEIEVRVEEVSC